jgi:hypothetical protein
MDHSIESISRNVLIDGAAEGQQHIFSRHEINLQMFMKTLENQNRERKASPLRKELSTEAHGNTVRMI